MSEFYRVSVIRSLFWIVAILLGLAQTWSSRHAVFSDGISYLDIAGAYVRGDWSNAINPYWSPLYSWAIALADLLLRPTPYWQVAVLHLINFLAYVASLFAFEFFMAELILLKQNTNANAFSSPVLYIAGYSAALFAGLSLVGVWYCSPDMIALALMLAISALILRVYRGCTTDWTFVQLGILCAALFLARTAFAAPFVICLIVIAAICHFRGISVVRPILIVCFCMMLLASPFIAAISHQVGRLSIGESGRLNYGWEINGAARFAHWQGEPYDIGKPKHPTTLAVALPKAYTFPQPIAGSYPPWFNPWYWYDGITPKFEVQAQWRVLVVNVSVLANLLLRSPLLVASIVLLLWLGAHLWWHNFRRLWPVLVPSAAVLGLYSFVYVEKRYIAANLLILWIAALISFAVVSSRRKVWMERFIVAVCLLHALIFVVRRQMPAIKNSVWDLVHFQEKEWNVDYLLAERLRQLGVRPGDKVAYIGPAVDADWVRLDGARIVAEIPLTYERNKLLLNNTLLDKTDDIKNFWKADAATQEKVFQAFRNAGAKLVVTDGYYDEKFVSAWPKVLAPDQSHLPKADPSVPSQVNSRYLFLDNVKGSSGS